MIYDEKVMKGAGRREAIADETERYRLGGQTRDATKNIHSPTAVPVQSTRVIITRTLGHGAISIAVLFSARIID